ncbi:MAG: C4-dicarboxylate TRAP transporter substrate-binding protein [Pseudomonadota bacterium]|nr:C4-dicarboxylate TRAP transporter substrate-binding protein [Pseudomonadota bacterium]
MTNRLKQAAIAATLIAAGSGAAYAETVLRFSDYGPNRGSRAAALEWFAAELDERSGGDMKVEFFWGGSLLGGRDTLSGVGDGVADMGTVVGFFTPKELELYNIGDLPVENSDIKIGMRAMYDLSRDGAVKDEFAAANVHYVTNFSTGPVQLICRDEITSIEDIDGLKIRASGPYGDTLKRLGAEIVSMSQADVYQSLDSGLLDCNQNYYYAMVAYRQYEVAPYVLALDWGQNMSFGVVMNQFTYDGLSDENKAVFDEVSADFIDYFAEDLEQVDAKARADMEAGIEGASITVTELSEADRAKLVETSAASIDDWIARVSESGKDGAGLLSAYQELIDTHSAAE